MSATYVIVDDRDPSISYDGNWTEVGAGAEIEFLSTTTQSTSLGATMEGSFSGKSVFAFGTLGHSVDPQTVNITFTIDDSISSSNILTSRTAPSHHIAVFNVTSLEDTTHFINLDLSGQFASQLFLDYLIVEATENSTISHPSTSRIFIDDSSPYLSWSGDWVVATPPWVSFNDSFTQVDGTFNGSVTGGVTSGASMTLNFVGTSVDVYGMAIATSAPPASYTIDDSIPFNVSMPVNIGDASPAFNWHYISVHLSSGGNHTLVVTCQIVNSFYVDYVLVESDTTFVPLPTAAENGAHTTSSVGSMTSSPEFTTATSPPSPAPSKAATKPTKSGVTVGGVVGVISVVGILMLGVFLWRRRRRPIHRHVNGHFIQNDESPPRSIMNQVAPFTLARPTSSMRAPKNTRQGTVTRLESNAEAGSSRLLRSQSPSNISEVAVRAGHLDRSRTDTMPPAYTA